MKALGWADTAAGRRRYVERLERRAAEEAARRCGIAPAPQADARRSHLRRGWYWGTQTFAEKLQALMGAGASQTVNRTYRAAGQHRAHGEAQAQRLLAEGLAREGLTSQELTKLPGSDRRKVRVAQALWKTTTVDQHWIAEHLGMKSAANVSQILRRAAAPSRYVD